MRTISKRGKKSDVEKKSVFLCKTVDPEFLGREIYADNVETLHNFYLIREINLAKDYQNLAEGEAYFDAICDSWDAAEEFNKLVVKKIYMYVETELMYYTLLMGSFEPLNREAKSQLKQWLTDVTVEKEAHSLTHKGNTEVESAELNSVMKQMMEASNEMFRLRKMIGDLSETIGQARLEAKAQPLMSRSVHTIHLKRAQPLVIDNEEVSKEPIKKIEQKEEAPTIDGEYSEEPVIEIQQVTIEPTEPAEEEIETGKKPMNGSSSETVQEDIQLAEEDTALLKERKDEKAEVEESSADKLRRKNLENQTEKAVIEEAKAEKPLPEVKQPEISDEERRNLLLSKLILEKEKTRKRTPGNWPRFSKLLQDSHMVPAPKKIPNFSRSEMENLEDDIYLRFMNKRINIGKKKSRDQKRRIPQSELLSQISKAEYLSYSWGQVLKQRKEDVLICNRLSSAGLVSGLDDFLYDMKRTANRPSLLTKKVRCSVDKLRRLDGYVLMDQYMQKLSQISKEDYK
ncbi:hypothetical protein [Candidatus Enterococcus clewellii]|uniref:Uncharacterized protein n=1 Tax=Candidatus Enterococcus clewellii TaxID=1834193 RepID=A0A242K722_9ENTE|nr:hypothetical protein [Enterococcus sp. 9E7_DIV0242]OTP16118.1 hypothetical protein A5888_002332 [Enterococcus sp. 9E7_DIV0242]